MRPQLSTGALGSFPRRGAEGAARGEEGIGRAGVGDGGDNGGSCTRELMAQVMEGRGGW
jgi:hypothetical protein